MAESAQAGTEKANDLGMGSFWQEAEHIWQNMQELYPEEYFLDESLLDPFIGCNRTGDYRIAYSDPLTLDLDGDGIETIAPDG